MKKTQIIVNEFVDGSPSLKEIQRFDAPVGSDKFDLFDTFPGRELFALHVTDGLIHVYFKPKREEA